MKIHKRIPVAEYLGSTKPKQIINESINNLPRTATIDELISVLTEEREKYGGDTLVFMTADYGDRSHTVQALPIRNADSGSITESAYSTSGWAVKSHDDYYDDDDYSDDFNNTDDEPTVILLA